MPASAMLGTVMVIEHLLSLCAQPRLVGANGA
jgi:hypothetical protein